MGERQSSLSALRPAAPGEAPLPAGGTREPGREAAGPTGPEPGSRRRSGEQEPLPAGVPGSPERSEEPPPAESPTGGPGVGGEPAAPPEEGPGPDGGSSRRRLPPRRHVYCTVYCVENDRAGPGSPPAGALAGDPLTSAGSIEVDFYLLPEPFSGLIAGDFGPLLVLRCRVCLEEKPVKPLPCCKKAVCEECLKRYLSAQVQLGQADIKCPITECSEHLDETTVLYNLPHDDIIKYKYFLELSRIDSSTKPCPQCKHFTTFRRRGHIPTPTKLENKYKIHIQRTEGCDHMTCSQCNTNFCYRCGERYRQLRFFGDHTSNLSIFGCKYRYLPERPHLRRLVRGSVCAGKLLIAPLILVLGLALGAIAVVIGLFVFPIYCLCKKQRKRSRTGMPW
ncbi:E3 ubiquitin-protein ligase RNF217 isoform X3 [Carettochelys insculpta]|uniref:E3 ubiquitin-protein ligase RNF217 isoform X3 n=1 Tax=Carettochelys insculpta TaxID=44489 RepID=UPI003EB7DDBE